MVGKCCNNACSAPRHRNQGKTFRVDIDLANAAGQSKRKTFYLWLCSACASQMNPEVAVKGDSVQVRLARIHPILIPVPPRASAAVN